MPARPSSPDPATRLTSADIRHVAGDVEDTSVAALLDLELSYAELELAAKFATGNSEDIGWPVRPLTSRAAQASDILLSDPAFAPLERDR